MKPVDPRLLRWAAATRVFLLASVLAGAITTATVIAQAALLAGMITEVFQQDAGLADIQPQVMALAGVVVVRAVLAFAVEWLAFRSAARAKSELRIAVLEHAVELGPQFLDRRSAGELAQLTGRGIDALDAYFARYLPQLVLAVMVPVAIIAVVAGADLLAAVIIALTLPLIPVFMILVGLYTRTQVDRQWRTLGILAGHFLDVVAGLPTLKLFGRARAQADTLRSIGDRYRRATMGVLRVSFLSALVLELLATLSVAIVAVAIGLRLVNGTIDLYTGLLVLILAPEAYLPLRLVGAQFHAAADGMAAAEELLDILETPVDATSAADRRQPIPAGTSAPATLTVADLTVLHPERTRPAVTHLSLTAAPGRITALAGPSGAGKSTVLRAVLGFVAVTEGHVALRSATDTYREPETRRDDWLAQFAWLPQEPVMVAGTVADNIRLGRPDATDTDVHDAANRAGLRDTTILTQPVAEGGAGVSVGQRRRIGLARVLVRDAPIVLLDEPSAALDEATESIVAAAIMQLREAGRTIVLVAHRSALAGLADTVVSLAAPDTDDDVTSTHRPALPGLAR